MLLSNVCLMLNIHVRSSRISGHITSKSLGRLKKSYQRDSILIDPTVSYSPSEAGKGGIVQWFPDLINAGKNLGAAQKRATKYPIGSVEAQG